jgi:hypothetical protein
MTVSMRLLAVFALLAFVLAAKDPKECEGTDVQVVAGFRVPD